MTAIILIIEGTYLSSIIGDQEPKTVCDELKSMYKLTSEARVDRYLSKYHGLRMEQSKTVMSYVNILRELENKLSELVSSVKDMKNVRVLLLGLRDEFSVTAEDIRA